MHMIRARRILKRLSLRGIVMNVLMGEDGLLMDLEEWEVFGV